MFFFKHPNLSCQELLARLRNHLPPTYFSNLSRPLLYMQDHLALRRKFLKIKRKEKKSYNLSSENVTRMMPHPQNLKYCTLYTGWPFDGSTLT